MAIRVITHIRTKAGAADDFMYTWDRKRYDDVVGLPGCDQYELFQSALEPEQLYVVENWQTRSAFFSGWKILRVQVMVGEELLAEPTDQPNSGYRTEIYWDLTGYEPGDPLPANGCRIVVNENVLPDARDAYVEAWKAATVPFRGAAELDLLLGTRNHENVAELGTWRDAAGFAEYARLRFGEASPLSGFVAPAEERMSGEAGIEVYDAPAFYRWDGTEWVESAGLATRT